MMGHQKSASLRRFADDTAGVTPVITVVLTVAMTVTAAAAPVVYIKVTEGATTPAIANLDIKVSNGGDGWGTGNEEVVVKQLGGRLLTVQDLSVVVEIDATRLVIEGEALGIPGGEPLATPGTPWTYTTSIPWGAEVHIAIIHQPVGMEHILDEERFTIQEGVAAYSIQAGGGIAVGCSTTSSLEVLGTELTYGQGGPEIPIRIHLSTDGGASYAPLFGDAAVQGGNTYTIGGVGPGDELGLRVFADYGSLHLEYESFSGDQHILYLANGATPPATEAFGDQDDLAGFLQPYVAPDTGLIALAPSEVIVLVEFNADLQSSAADYQDLVVLFDMGLSACA